MKIGLNIFNNEKFNGEKIIAPKSKGKCEFYIENAIGQDTIYNIEFLDEMKTPINMKYKLKINNIYIRGNEETYVDIKELGTEDIIVLKDSITKYTLEWYWEDDDTADTYVGGKEKQYYTLKLNIKARTYNNAKEE